MAFGGFDPLADSPFDGANPLETGVTETPQQQFPDVLGDMRQRDKLTSAAKIAAEKKPDTAARIFKIGAKTSLPNEVIERNLDDLEKQVAAKDFDTETFRKNSPLLAAWLTENKDHLALVQDDLGPLQVIERSLGVAWNSVRSVAAGINRTNAAMWGVVENVGDVTGIETLSKVGRAQRASGMELADIARGKRSGMGSGEQAFYSGFESIGQMLYSAPGAMMSGPAGVTALLSQMGASVYGESYGESRDKGVGTLASMSYAASQTAIEIATEKIPASRLLGDIAKRAPIGKMLLRQLSAEIPGEQVATILQDLNTWAVLNPDEPFSTYLEARPGAIYQTLIATVVAVAAPVSAVRVLDRIANGKPIQQKTLEDIGAAVQESKLRERSPEKFAEVVQRATASGLEEIGIPIESFVTYWQEQGIDPATIAEQWTGDATAFEQATATGADLVIPTARYITEIAPTQHNAFFALEARLEPTGMTAREELAFEQAEAAKFQPPPEDPQAALHQEFTTRALAAGYDPVAADTHAAQIAEAFVNLSERSKIDLPTIVKTWLPEMQAFSGSGRRRPMTRAPISATLPLDDVAAQGTEAPAGTGPQDGLAEYAPPDALRDAPEGRAGQVIEARRPDDLPAPYRALFAELAADARARGFAGTDEQLAGAFAAKIDIAREIAKELGEVENETNSAALLQAIADAGGLSALQESGMLGELNQLQENLGGTYQRTGRGKFNKGEKGATQYTIEATTPGIRGPIVTRRAAIPKAQRDFAKLHGKKAPKPGLSWDGMLEYLTEAGFQFDDLADMIESIFEAVADYQNGSPSVASEVMAALTAESGVGVRPGVDWWSDLTLAQESSDMLDTGEEQPRLPGAEGVREQEHATPEFDAPWSLTAEVEKADIRDKQTTLFQDMMPSDRVSTSDLEAMGFDTSRVYYHQTAERFVDPIEREGFDLSKGRARLSDELVPDGVFFKPDERNIMVGGTGRADDPVAQIPVYLKFGKTATFTNRDNLKQRLIQDPEYKALAEEVARFDKEQDAEFQKLWVEPERSEGGPGVVDEKDVRMGLLMEAWTAGTNARAAAARARATELFRKEKVDTVIIKVDQGSGKRSTETVIAIGGNQVALAREGRETILFQPAWHGSPYLFDRFSIDKIGSGEGAAAYGWGLYFAENPKVAEGYRKRLAGWGSPYRLFLKSNPRAQLEETSPERHAASLIYFNDRATVKRLVKTWMADVKTGDPGMADTARHAGLSPEDYWGRIERFVNAHSKKDIRAEQGSIYQVDIDDWHVKQMLDWDAPVSEQPEAVQDIVREEMKRGGYLKENENGPLQLTAAWRSWRMEHGGIASSDSGQAVYEMLEKRAKRDNPDEDAQKAASLFLLSRGVVGNKYFDEGSRGKSKRNRTRNFVVFDDSIIKVTHRDGSPLTAAERTELFQGKTDEKRGAITFNRKGPNGETLPPLVQLFAARNLSTLWHEAGHLFMRMHGAIADDLALRDPATLDPQQQKLLADYRDIVLPWLEAESTQSLTTAQQEKVARTFELYMMKGEAPSVGLRRVFARARAWMLHTYRGIRGAGGDPRKGLSIEAGFNVTINPEIKAVFDRLLASDEAIAAARSDPSVSAVFTTAEEAGWTPAVFEAYKGKIAKEVDADRERVQQQIMREREREEREAWKAERAQVREEIAAAVAQRREYEALAVITKGMHADGTRFNEDVEPEPLQLSKKKIVSAYGKDALAGLPKGAVTTGEGLTADELAEMVGYSSGAELLTDLRDLTPMDQTIDLETDAEMRARHGDIVLDGSLADVAREAVMGEDGRVAIVEMEMKAIGQLARQINPALRAVAAEERQRVAAGRAMLASRVPSRESIQRVAARQIAITPLAQIRPLRHFQAARTAAQKAIDLVARKDYEAALTAKIQHLLNLELYREAVAAGEAVDEARALAKRAFRADADIAKTRNMDFVAAARAILAPYFAPDRVADVFQAMDDVRTYDPQLYASLIGNVTQATSQGGTLKTLTYEQFVGMRDAAQALWTAARHDQQITIQGEKIERGLAVDNLNGRLDEVGPKRPEPPTKRQMAMLGMRAAMTRVEHWVTFMDGGPSGFFREYLWTPISQAADAFRADYNAYLARFLGLAEGIGKTLGPERIAAPELADGFAFKSRAAMLHAILHSGNESNLQKLLRGYGWGGRPRVPSLRKNGQPRMTRSGQPIMESGALDRSRWDAFIARAIDDGTLTEADFDFAQRTWNLFEELKPQAQKAHRDMYGHTVAMLAPTPIETPWGTYAGGYVPAIVDYTLVPHEKRMEVEQAENALMMPTTGRGFMKGRNEGYAAPLALDLNLIPQHLNKVLRFIHLEPRVKDVGKLVLDRRFRARMTDYDPAAVNDLLVPWLQRAAKQEISRPGRYPWLDKVAREVRSRTGSNIMFANVVNTLQQLTGLMIAAVEVKPRHMRNALWRYSRDPKAYSAWVLEHSKFMPTRTGPTVFAMQTKLNDLLLNPSKYQSLKAFGDAHAYILQQHAQNMVDFTAWGGAYEQAIAEGVYHAEAVRRADSIVRETQGSFAPEDMSDVEAASPFVRAFIMFYSYFNMLANLLGTRFALVARDMGLRKGAGRAFYIYTMGLMMPAVLGEVIRGAIGGFDVDDDDSYMDEAMAIFFGAHARLLAGMVPGVGPIALAGINMWNDKPYDDRISTSPVVSSIERSARAPVSVYEAIADPEKSKKNAIQDTLTLIGLLTSLPVQPLGRPLGYLADVFAGEEEPEGADLLQGLVTGRSQKDR